MVFGRQPQAYLEYPWCTPGDTRGVDCHFQLGSNPLWMAQTGIWWPLHSKTAITIRRKSPIVEPGQAGATGGGDVPEPFASAKNVGFDSRDGEKDN